MEPGSRPPRPEASLARPPTSLLCASCSTESFLALFESRTANHSGLWVLDEPESALSFDGSLVLLGMLTAYLRRDDAQVILPTHSPILAALPGATIWEVGAWGMTRRTWERLEFVASWRRFFEDPGAVLAGLDG